MDWDRLITALFMATMFVGIPLAFMGLLFLSAAYLGGSATLAILAALFFAALVAGFYYDA